MIITLKGADFSQDNIGQITLPADLDNFTLSAISMSGNTNMSDAQKSALNDFFENIGAFGTKSTIFQKLEILMLPIICSDVTYGLVDYKGGQQIDLSATDWELVSNGIKAKADVNAKTISSTAITVKNKTIGFYTTQPYDHSTVADTNGMLYHNGTTYSGFRITVNTTKLSIRNFISSSKYFGSEITGTTFQGLIADVFRDSIIQTYTNKTISTKNLTAEEIAAYSTGSSGTLYLNSNASWKTKTTGAPIGAMFFGNELSNEEMAIMSDSLDSLFAAFVG